MMIPLHKALRIPGAAYLLIRHHPAPEWKHSTMDATEKFKVVDVVLHLPIAEHENRTVWCALGHEEEPCSDCAGDAGLDACVHIFLGDISDHQVGGGDAADDLLLQAAFANVVP